MARRSFLGTAVRAKIIGNAVGNVAERSARAKAQAAQSQQVVGQVHQAPATQSPIAPAVAAGAPTNEAHADLIPQLESLAKLHAAGALSDDEFAGAKARLLG